ncbi:hypothetical protein C8E89_11162 [Mycolicibacterium moriokaense]|uniref:Uncharacterized protein n=2 Tax=Mycolicibacterium moriokaense TaxID=39691 RepID=A0A318HEE8_9MYCO|nr:hypothetical protein C8E89_11162 [Mycolicibacterium moriokaense]
MSLHGSHIAVGWDRHGARYSCAISVVAFASSLPPIRPAKVLVATLTPDGKPNVAEGPVRTILSRRLFASFPLVAAGGAGQDALGVDKRVVRPS